MPKAIKAVIEAIRGKDFEAYKKALNNAKQENIDMFECHNLIKNNSNNVVGSLFGYLLKALGKNANSVSLSAGAGNIRNEVSDLDWLNLMLETLDTKIEDEDKDCDYEIPYFTLLYFQKIYPEYFTKETIEGYLRVLEEHTNINAVDDYYGESILNETEDKDLAELLIKYGADPNNKGVKGASGCNPRTPLEHAIFMWKDMDDDSGRDIELAETLLKAGADPNTKIRLSGDEDQKEWGCELQGRGRYSDKIFDVPILYLLVHVFNDGINNDEKTLKLIKLLLEYGADPNLPVEEIIVMRKYPVVRPYYPIVTANADKDIDLLKLLLKYGASTEVKDSDGCTPLLRAVKNGNAKSVDLLLKHGADVFATDGFGNNIFHLVYDKEILDIALKHISKRKLKHKAKMALNAYNSFNYEEQPPIYAHFYTLCVTELEDARPWDLGYMLVGKKEEYSEKVMEIIPALVDAGADINLGESQGRENVLHYIVDINHWDDINKKWMRMAIELGGDVNAQDDTGRTPLITAARNYRDCYSDDFDNDEKDRRFLDIAAILIEAGADVNIKDEQGNNAFDYLSERNMAQRLKNLQDMIYTGRFNEELEEELYER